MIISHSRKFVFIHLHKAGGTSLECGLDPFLSWNDLILGSTPFGEAINPVYRSRFGLDKHSSVGDLNAVCGAELLDNYYIFSIVRHPVSRLCSLYNFVGSHVFGWSQIWGVPPDGMAGHIEQNPILLEQAPELTWLTSGAFMRASNFSEFIRIEKLIYDAAFHSQVSRLTLSPETPLKTDVYKLEDAKSWLPVIRKKIGIDFDLPHKNESVFTLVTPDKISAEDKDYIYHRYAEDCAALGY